MAFYGNISNTECGVFNVNPDDIHSNHYDTNGYSNTEYIMSLFNSALLFRKDNNESKAIRGTLAASHFPVTRCLFASYIM